jgi:hypothetical protein
MQQNHKHNANNKTKLRINAPSSVFYKELLFAFRQIPLENPSSAPFLQASRGW